MPVLAANRKADYICVTAKSSLMLGIPHAYAFFFRGYLVMMNE